MKKLFFYAAAALAMLASCQKTEINESPSNQIDDSKPVAMQLNVNSPSFEVTKTKAAVDEWNNTTVYIYGLQRGVKGVVATGEDKYDFDDILIDAYEATVVDESTPLEIYQNPDETDPTKKAHYFYAEGETYDFFGYHLGGLTAGEVKAENDEISFPVTITGQQDLMVAAADKANDIKDDQSTDGVTESDVYSAWAARRGVHPTLDFKHALTRFNFIVRGMNDKAENLQITGISMPNLKTTGILTVVGDILGYDATGDVVAAGLSLPAPTDATPADVVKGNTTAYSDCLMIEPGLEEVEVKVTMKHDTYNSDLVKIEPYSFTVNASQVLKDGVAAKITEFEKGTAYNIYVNVYGPEEIVIKAELTAWENGGEYTYDPDQERPGNSAAPVTAEPTVENGTLTYAVTYNPAKVSTLEGYIGKSAPANDKDWTPLITKATTGISIPLEDGENADDYNLYIRYKETASSDWVVINDVQPEAFVIKNSYLVVETKESYEQLPEAYRSAKGEWSKYQADLEASKADPESEFIALPWLAVEFTGGATISGTAVCGDFTYQIEPAKSTIGLITLSAEEMELAELTPGEWTVTLNGVETKITVPGAEVEEPEEDEPVVESIVKKSYVVVETEESYNQLPAAYRAAKGEWAKYQADLEASKEDPESEFNALPWLAVETTPNASATFVVSNGETSKKFTWTLGEIGLATFSAEEVGVALEGDWTVTVTIGEATQTAEFTVPAPAAE